MHVAILGLAWSVFGSFVHADEEGNFSSPFIIEYICITNKRINPHMLIKCSKSNTYFPPC
jgi:hypothetical protein